jgi:hypothetical protein
MAKEDDVCVIGTNVRASEFALTIRSDQNAQQSWQEIKRLSLPADGDKDSDSPERRIRDLQYKLLDESPPTATLIMTEYYWALNDKDSCSLGARPSNSDNERMMHPTGQSCWITPA